MAPSFEPKTPVDLDPPKDTPLTLEQVAQCDGERNQCMWIAIMGTVFDVSKNTKMYGVGKGYHALVGKDASRALGKSSLDAEDVDPKVSWDYSSLNEKQLKTLNDWYTFFSKRYNIVGKIVDLPSTSN